MKFRYLLLDFGFLTRCQFARVWIDDHRVVARGGNYPPGKVRKGKACLDIRYELNFFLKKRRQRITERKFSYDYLYFIKKKIEEGEPRPKKFNEFSLWG